MHRSEKLSDEAAIMDALSQAIKDGDDETAAEAARQWLEAGLHPLKLINECGTPATRDVGDRFGRFEIFPPEPHIIGGCHASRVGHPHSRDRQAGHRGAIKVKVVIGTVHGDIHDIGKNLVAVSEDVWMKLMTGIMISRVIDVLECPSLATVYGRTVLAGTPLETSMSRVEVEWRDEVLKRVSRPRHADGRNFGRHNQSWSTQRLKHAKLAENGKGKPLQELYDLETLTPVPEWQEMADRVKSELVDIGLPLVIRGLLSVGIFAPGRETGGLTCG